MEGIEGFFGVLNLDFFLSFDRGVVADPAIEPVGRLMMSPYSSGV